MDEKIKILLYRSFDEDLNPDESKMLEKVLEKSEELQKEKEKITRLRVNINEGKASAFKPFFAERVLNRIQASVNSQEADTFFESLIVIFRPVAIAAVVLIISVAAYNIITSGQISIEGALAVPEVTLDDAYDTSLAVVMEEE